jgi:hypothetical protein
MQSQKPEQAQFLARAATSAIHMQQVFGAEYVHGFNPQLHETSVNNLLTPDLPFLLNLYGTLLHLHAFVACLFEWVLDCMRLRLTECGCVVVLLC